MIVFSIAFMYIAPNLDFPVVHLPSTKVKDFECVLRKQDGVFYDF